MNTSFAFYADAALNHPISTLSLPTTEAAIRQIWLASRLTGRRLRPPENEDSILLTIGGGAAASVRLATSRAALASAPPGATLSLGARVSGAMSIFVHIAPSVGNETTEATLSLAAREMGIG